MDSTVRVRQIVSRVLQVSITAAAFAALNAVGWWFQIDRGVSIFYPATAVDVVACMHFGIWGAIGVFLGCLATPWQAGEALWQTAFSGLLNVAEGMIPWLVFRYRRELSRDLHDLKSLAAFVVFGCILNSAVSALAGNLVLIPGPLTFTSLFTWWVSDFSAAVVLGVPVLAFAGGLLGRLAGRGEERHGRTLANAVTITAVIILLGWMATTSIQVYLAQTIEQQRSVAVRSALRTGDTTTLQKYEERASRVRTVTLLMHQMLLLILIMASARLILGVGRPLRQIHRQVEQLRRGQRFDPDAVRSNLIEIRDLAETIAGTTRDLEARESALREQTARAVAASKAKSEFLAKMSHELRTPLNSIIGFSDILRERGEDLPAERRGSFLHNIERSARHLLYLINDLLDMAKVEAGRMTFHKQIVDVRMIVEATVGAIGPLVREKGQRIETIMPEVAVPVYADATRVEQVILNLLSNANKFSPNETVITVTLSVEGGECELAVRDEGMGISEEDQSFIFEDFTQLGHDPQTPGTGLGLGLAKRLIEAQGGSIAVDSRAGAGATFRIRMPVYEGKSVPVSA